MRVSDDRYQQELRRLNLAMRLLRFKAKSATIRFCTSLTEDRVRKLFKTYLESQFVDPRRRKRGKSPHEPAMLLRNTRVHLQSSTLATLLIALEVADTHLATPLHNLAQAERCCDAFEYYLQLFDDPEFTFEHAWLLMKLLSARAADASPESHAAPQVAAELKLIPCPQCHAMLLQDACSHPMRPCPFCDARVGPARPRRRVRGPRPLPLRQASLCNT